jgi:hypothetical protein
VQSSLSVHLRARKNEIATVWESLVRATVPALASLERSALLDHLPEFLEGLAHWIEGDTTSARSAFSALAEGHALQRLGYGIDLVTLTREYMLLRSTILRELMAAPAGEQGRELMVRLNEGIDEAIHEGVRRYIQGLGVRSELRVTDMGDLCEHAARDVERAHRGTKLVVTRSGDLHGMWDHRRVVEVLRAMFERALGDSSRVSVKVSESEDREAVVAEISGAARVAEPTWPAQVRDLAVSHGARLYPQTGAVAIEWPRTPLDEIPSRV